MTAPDSIPRAAEASPGGTGARGRLARGLIAKVLELCGIILQQILLVPVFLYAWGAEVYRDWIALAAAASLLTLVDCGLASHFANRLLINWSRGERAAFIHTLRVALGHYTWLLGIVVPLALAVALLVPWHAILGIATLDRVGAATVLVVLGAFALMMLPLSPIIAVYRARGMIATQVLADAARILAPAALTIAALLLGAGPTGVAVSQVAALTVLWLIMVARQKTRFGELSYRPALPSLHDLRETLAIAPYFALVPISLAVTVHGTVLLIAASGGALVVFATLRTLNGFTRSVAEQMGIVLGVELARRHAQGDIAATARLYRFVGRSQGMLNGALSGLVLVLGPPFMTIWTLGKVPLDMNVFLPLLAAVALAGPAQAAERLLVTTNRPRGLAAALLARAAATLALAAVLVPAHGAAGAAVAVLIADVCVLGTLLPRVAAGVVNIDAWRRIAEIQLAAAVAFAASAVAAYAAVWLIGGARLPELFAAAAVWAAIMLPPAYLLVLDAGTRRWVADRVRRSLRIG